MSHGPSAASVTRPRRTFTPAVAGLDFAPAGLPFGGSGVMTFADDLWVSSMSLSIAPISVEEVVTIRSLTVERVPEPPSAWLMALAVASLPLMRGRVLARQSASQHPPFQLAGDRPERHGSASWWW